MEKQLDMAFPNRWGGRRQGAGRKRTPGRRRVPHLTRPEFKSRFPIMVTIRIDDAVPRLRGRKIMQILARGFVFGCKRSTDVGSFRICQFSIQGNHIHLLCEADNKVALARGIQGFKVRVARAINKHLGGRRGAVFDDRYHSAVLANPRQVRTAVCYVMQNSRRHGRCPQGWVDPYSSARYFDGWDGPIELEPAEPGASPPVAQAKTWLLRTGWRRWGLIGINETPAAGRDLSFPA